MGTQHRMSDQPPTAAWLQPCCQSALLGGCALTPRMIQHLIMEQRWAMLEAESSSSDSSSDADSSSKDSLSDSDSESDVSDNSRDRRLYRRSSTPPCQYRRDSPRRGQGDSRTPSPSPHHRRDLSRCSRNDSQSASPPQSCRDDDRPLHSRSGYGLSRVTTPRRVVSSAR